MRTKWNSEAQEITTYSYSQTWIYTATITIILIKLWHDTNHNMTQYQSYYDTIPIRLPIHITNSGNEIPISFQIQLARLSLFPERSLHAFRLFCRNFLDLQTNCPWPLSYRDSMLFRVFWSELALMSIWAVFLSLIIRELSFVASAPRISIS